MRGMNSIKGNVEKEWLSARVVAKKLDGILRQQVRAVAFVITGFVVAVPIMTAIAVVREVIYRAVVMTVLST